ncbi:MULTISPECIES: hypothetical protein [unclassified Psychrobacter]|uniref:hypothetical protein n=1 Tax=unclassified Psychrobacter TaxID=196806 RepID=UPI003F471F5A
MRHILLKSKRITRLLGIALVTTVVGISACNSETEEANDTVAVDQSTANVESTAMTKEESVTEEPSELMDNTMPDNTNTDEMMTDSAENTNIDKTDAEGLQ